MRKPVFGVSDEAQDIDAKRVEAIQMAKIVPEPRFPRREQSETTHKMGVKGSLGHLFCFYTYDVNVLWMRSDTNQAIKPQKMARVLKYRIHEEQ